MEIDNLEKKIKVRKKYVIPLVILGVLIAILIVVLTFLYFKLRDPKSIYYGIIDSVSNDVIELLEDVYEDEDTLKAYTGDISFDMESNIKEFNEIAKIINKIMLTTKVEIDSKNVKEYMDFSVTYKNEDVLNGNFFMNNTGVYGKFEDLYNKPIKFASLEDGEIEKIDYINNFIVIIDELRNIIKDSLKDEYFEINSEKIYYLNKKINVNKNTLTLSKEILTEIINNVINNININDKLLNSFSKISGLTKEELIGKIKAFQKELILDDTKYVIDVYQKKLEIYKVAFKIDDEQIIIEKDNENIYSVSIYSEGINHEVATITKNDDMFNLIFNIEEDNDKFVMNLKINDEECYLILEIDSSVLELKMNSIAIGLIDGYVSLKDNIENLTIRADFTLEVKNIEHINEINTKNSINVDDINDNEYELIAQKLLQNSGFMSLVQDILTLEFMSSLFIF